MTPHYPHKQSQTAFPIIPRDTFKDIREFRENGEIGEIGEIKEIRENLYLVFEGLWLSVRIVQNGKNNLGSLLTEGYSFRFGYCRRQPRPRNKSKNSHVVKLPETQFRLKGFGHLFSKRCEKKGFVLLLGATLRRANRVFVAQ